MELKTLKDLILENSIDDDVLSTNRIIDFVHSLKDDNGDKIPELKDSIMNIEDIIVIVVNYFKQNTHKPLFYNNNNKITNINSFIEILESNVHTINKYVINIFKHAVLLFNQIYDKNIVNGDISNIYAHYIIKDSGAIQDFVRECLLVGNFIDPMFIDIISVLINNNTQKLDVIIEGIVQGCLLKEGDIFNIISKFFEKYPEKIPEIIEGLFEGLSKGIFEGLSKGLSKSYLSKGANISNIISKFFEKYPEKIPEIIEGLSKYCLSEDKKYPDNFITSGDLIIDCLSINKINHHFMFQRLVIKLIQLNTNNIEDIVSNLIQSYLLKYKMSDLKSFFIKASKQKDIGIDIIYNFIRVCVLNRECQLDSENMKYLINFVKDENNKIAYKSKIILCGMYVSDYLLKLHNNEINKNIQIPEEFINLLSEVLDRKIQKIEDLTIREIKLLFDELISIKFNETKEGVNTEALRTGPFLQIIISLAENSDIEDNTTIEKLFNRGNQKDIEINDCQDKLNDFGYINIRNNTKINSISNSLQNLKFNKTAIIELFNKINYESSIVNDCQDKLNNFGYIRITNDTKIDSVKTFLEILKLKESDFNKTGFKTFYVDFPRHGTAIVIDTSKSYDDFIKDNEEVIKDIIMIDSSKSVNLIMNNGILKFSDPNTQDFIKKIPVPNIEYQENGTCWANACCANSALLNNYKSFNEIVQKNEKNEVIGLQEGVQENIINETSEYFLSNVKKIEDKNEYEKTYTDQSITIKTNFSSNQAFQNINYMYKAQRIHLIKLKNRLTILYKLKQQKSTDTFEYNKNIYCRKVEKFKKCIERLENIPKFIVTRNSTPILDYDNTIRFTNETVDYDTDILLEHLKTATNELFNNIQSSNDKNI